MSRIETSPNDRLARLHRWCRTGRASAAELELSDWCRGEDATPAARVLLASLRAQRGDLRGARATWATGDLEEQRFSVEEKQAIIALDTLLGRNEEAATMTRLLHHRFGKDSAVGRWLAVSDAPGVAALPAQSAGQAEELAEALQARMEIIPSLVFAQRQRPSTGGIARLRAALLRLAARTERHADQALSVCRALAQLAQLVGDEDEARRWAHRGLKIDPYCATLAMILSWVPDDEAAGEPARDVLARVHEKHPGYRDIADALKRREADPADPQTHRRAA